MEFRQRHIRGQSATGDVPSDLLSGHFDLLLIAPSWDPRSVCMTDCTDLSAEDCILLLFSGHDPAGYRLRNERRLAEFARTSCKRALPVSGASLSLEETWRSLWDAIRQVAMKAQRPLRIALDLSTFPRFYSLAAIAGCLRLGYASNVSVFYSEGEYSPSSDESEPAEYLFSGGEWTTVPIYYLEGRRAPSRKKYIVVSVGFEGSKILRVLSREDPDRISVLFPDPGTRAGYPTITDEKNKPLLEMYNVPPEQVVRAHAADAIAVWKGLGQAALERPATENTYYLSCGTKPHALGMALRALCLGFPCVLYNVPERHNYLRVTPTGRYWTYHLQDLSIMQR